MIETKMQEMNLDRIIDILKEINTEYSPDEIRTYIDGILLKLLKEHILTIKIPKGISIKDLRKMRTGLKVMEKSGRWVKRIESFKNNYMRNLNYLKFKEIQDTL